MPKNRYNALAIVEVALIALMSACTAIILREYPKFAAGAALLAGSILMVFAAILSSPYSTEERRKVLQKRFFWVPLAVVLLSAWVLRMWTQRLADGIAVVLGISTLMGMVLGARSGGVPDSHEREGPDAR